MLAAAGFYFIALLMVFGIRLRLVIVVFTSDSINTTKKLDGYSFDKSKYLGTIWQFYRILITARYNF